jgi:putative glutamine amidotransferase
VSARVHIGLVHCGRDADYLEALRQAGAAVTVVDAEDPDALGALDEVVGLCLPGGRDVHPAHYGEAPHAAFDPSSPARDALEIRLARLAVAQDIPLLAICRGMQVLNVALGGTLVQDIPDQVPSARPHAVDDTLTTPAHEVHLTGGSWLRQAAEAGMPTLVNSRHHQAVRVLGPGLHATAVAPDQVIEGVELPGAAFCVGVQWHPENFWRSGESRALFDLFVGTARRTTRHLSVS